MCPVPSRCARKTAQDINSGKQKDAFGVLDPETSIQGPYPISVIWRHCSIDSRSVCSESVFFFLHRNCENDSQA